MVSADVSAGVDRPGELGLGDLVDQLGAGQRWLIEEADALDELDRLDELRSKRFARGIDKWVSVEAAALNAGLSECPIPGRCSTDAPVRCRFCVEGSRPFQAIVCARDGRQGALFVTSGRGGRH